MLIDGAGCWLSQVDGFETASGGAALFVDRDDLLIHDPGFLHRPEQVVLKPGAAALLHRAQAAGWPVIVVTNQSGIARGYYGWSDFEAVNDRMAHLLAAQGARLHAILACAFHPHEQGALARDHDWRKPGAGMVRAAATRLGVALAGSWLAGDRWSDIRAARSGGLAGAIRIGAQIGGVRRRRATDGFQLLTAPSLPVLLDTMPAWPADTGRAA